MLKFHISLPPATVEQLAKERGDVEAKMRKYELAMIPLVVFAFTLAYLLIKALYPLDSDEDFLQSAVRAVTTAVSVGVALLASWFYLYERHLAVFRLLEEIPPEACAEALRLADENVELETFRLAVVARRNMVMGDLRAMQDYANSKEVEKTVLAEKAQLDAAYNALHTVKVRRAASND